MGDDRDGLRPAGRVGPQTAFSLARDPALVFLTESTRYGRWAESATSLCALHSYRVRYAGGGFTLLAAPGFQILDQRLIWFRGRNRFAIFDLQPEKGTAFSVLLLGLDQVWGDSTVFFRHAEYGPALGSDHRKLDVFLTGLSDNCH